MIHLIDAVSYSTALHWPCLYMQFELCVYVIMVIILGHITTSTTITAGQASSPVRLPTVTGQVHTVCDMF